MLLRRIADYAVSEQTATLAPAVVHHAKRAVIDWHAGLFPGSRIAPAVLLEEALAEDLDRGRARLASGRRATLRAAALINGAASHSVETDDIYRDAGYHPGGPVISAALAAAQDRGASGEAFLRGVIVGYEVSTRIAEAVMPAHYEYWHVTGTVGAYGAAAAVATILGCSRDEFAHALATAGTFAAGLQQAFQSESMSKPLHVAHAADAGALAALAARRGVIGALDILDGRLGFGNAMSRNADWSKATRGLGEDYHITRITFKAHCCCAHSFAAIDGALHLKERHRLTPRDVKRVSVATYRAGVNIVGNHRAASDLEARFSLPYVLAHALVHGSVRLDAFAPDRLADPAVRELMQRVAVTADPELSAGYPGQRAARVEIETADGSKLSHFQPTRRGDPELPLSDGDLDAKYLELAGPVLGEDGARALLAELWALEKRKKVEFAYGAGTAAR
jgi:2-methylcitrate dehydratase PrpD